MYALLIKYFFSFSKLEKNLISYKPAFKFNIKSSPNYIVFLIKRVSKILFIRNCLIISICVFKTLKSYNHMPIIVVGVIKENNIFYSHAWVEVNNSFVFDNEKKDFKEIFRIS